MAHGSRLRVLHAGLDWGYWGKLRPGCLRDPTQGQIAGGETAMLRAAESMAAGGCEVVVVTGCTPGRDSATGVLYVNTLDFFAYVLDRGPWDAIGIWGDPDHFAELTSIGALDRTLRVCAQQCNGFTRPDGVQGFVDLYISPSRSHAANLARQHGIPIDRFRVIPNAVHPPRFHWDAPRVAERVYIASSPDRGRHHLLDLWPEVKCQEPKAELHVFYETRRWLEGCCGNYLTPIHPAIATRARSVMRAHDDAHYGLDVHDHGAAPQQAIVDLACTAGVMAYPCDPICYTEGYATAGLEAYCAGAVPVMTDADALREIYADKAILVSQHRIREDFAAAVVGAIREARAAKERGWLGWRFPDEKAAHAACERHSWAAVGEMWTALVRTEIVAKREREEAGRVAA